MKKTTLLPVAIFATTALNAQIITTANIKNVTVYGNKAAIDQTAQVNIPNGTSQIVVKNIANYVEASSVKIATVPGVTVLSVQYTTNYIPEYDAKGQQSGLQTVKDSITYYELQKQKLENAAENIDETLEFLKSNNKIGGVNGSSALEMKKAAEYYIAERAKLTDSNLVVSHKKELVEERIKFLYQKLNSNNLVGETNSNGKLVIQILADKATNSALDISYLTAGATWNPIYELTSQNINTNKIDLIYKAEVTQNTGIDWKNVKINLSSGTAGQNNITPELSKWNITYGYNNNVSDQDYSSVKFKSKIPTGSYTKMLEGQVAGLNVVNGYQNDSIERKSITALNSNVSESGLSLNFETPVKYDIASNNKAHVVVLNRTDLPATFQYYVVPKMNTNAYLLAKVSDYSSYNLLPGSATINFDNTFVGTTYLNPETTKAHLFINMGADKRINVKRTLVQEKSGSKFLSGTKEQNFTYETTIKNNKKEAISLMLQDQIPVSNDASLKVELVDDGGAKLDAETGFLTWELNLKEGETKKIRFTYIVKSDKDKLIENY